MNYPDLSNSKIISIDIETYDPELTDLGPGVYNGKGRLLGVAISDGEFSEYYNIGHEGIDFNLRRKNLSYIRQLLYFDVPKLGANIMYDLDWLCNRYRMKFRGKLHDVQIAEPLIDEHSNSYSLDNLAEKYSGKKKFKTEIDDFCEENKLKTTLKKDSRHYLYKMPFELVQKYAIEDARLPLQIFEKQKEILEKQNLIDVYILECELIPVLLQMRKTGVRIDLEKLEPAKKSMREELEKMKNEMFDLYGTFNYNSNVDLKKKFDELGIKYALTKKDNPSFSKPNMKKCEHPIAKKIIDIRSIETIYNNFLEKSFTKHNVNGGLHTTFRSVKMGNRGTRSGRFSSSNPNVQQVPADSGKKISKICRQLFVPEPGYLWAKLDYSQIEYRIIAHYASGPRSSDVRNEYIENPKTDYHKLVMQLTNLSRKVAKGLNFGTAYGMGKTGAQKQLNISMEETIEILNHFDRNVPFIRYTRNKVSQVAKSRGYIRTILGRRARMSEKMYAERKEYTMFNSLIQGTAADIFKKAMELAYKKGIFEILPFHLIVHDEFDVSVPKSREGALALLELKKTMEEAIPLKVPLIVDVEIGENWADVSEENFNNFIQEFA